jgi:hypothetical protein
MNPTFKKGMRVRVFNQVSDNFAGIIRAVNKRTARVEADSKYAPFTNHPYARNEDTEREQFLVPFRDLTVLEDGPSVHSGNENQPVAPGNPKSASVSAPPLAGQQKQENI